jgi:DNA-binding NarL/FixJ family response regulator
MPGSRLRLRGIAVSLPEFTHNIYPFAVITETVHVVSAPGYLHKEAPAADILRAIRSVYAGRRAFPRRIAERLSGERMTAGLSAREREILQLVAKGLTNKEVANTLNISQFTVRNHLNHITEKLEVTDRTEAIFVAIQTGIIAV